MGFRKFLARLLNASNAADKPGVSEKSYYFEEATGDCYAVRGEAFNAAYAAWLQSKTLPPDALKALGPESFVANLGNRSGYVREFCLRALALLDGSEAFKPVIQRLNDYVPSNRDLALQLTLKWLAKLPLATVIDALAELDSLAEQSRANHAAAQEALGRRLLAKDGRDALLSGLMHTRAKVRRACWRRCLQTFLWSDPERVEAALRCADPAIARSVEPDVFALADDVLTGWFPKLRQVRAMPLRRAFLVALHRRGLVDDQALIRFALLDDSFSIRWLARH